MKITTLCLAFSFMLLVSCSSKKADKVADDKGETEEKTRPNTLTDLTNEKSLFTLLCQHWENKEDAADVAASGGGGSLEMPYRGYAFYKDKAVSKDPRSGIAFGQWAWNEEAKQVTITMDDGRKEVYKVGGVGPKRMVWFTSGDKTKTEYIADGKAHDAKPEDDPFYPSNNTWRIKPAKLETPQELKQRALECIAFYQKFLQDNVDRGGNSISFVGLPGCFKWYRGGISVRGKAKTEQSWKNCFYNEEQAEQARLMIENIISKKYKWNKDEHNWVQQSADVMGQMYDTLKVSK